MKKVLVTGATGFIGSKTLSLLKQRGYEVHAVTSRRNINDRNTDVIWHCFDLTKTLDIEKLFKIIQPDELLHFAWYVAPGKYLNSVENIQWVKSSLEILTNFKNIGGKRFVFSGTCAEYDLQYGYLDENLTPSSPSSLYGTCKLAFENIALDYCKLNDISFVSGRVFYLYGDGEQSTRIVPYVINNLINDEIARCSHGEQIRDFLNVRDVASAFVEILNSGVEGVVNIGSGQAIRLKDILIKVGEKLGKNNLIIFGDNIKPNDEPKIIVANIKRLREETNWVQQYDLDRGIDETIQWWKSLKVKV